MPAITQGGGRARRGTDRRSPFVSVVLGLCAAMAVAPVAASAQDGPAVGDGARVGASVSLRSGVTWLGSHPLPIVAAAGSLRISDRAEIGAEAVFGLKPIPLSPESSPDRSELSTGYAGLLVRWRPAGDLPGVRWGGSVLTGAGAARIRSPLAQSAIVSKNYAFIEPRFNVLFRQNRALRFSAQIGYRATTGADEIPGIRVSEFRGATIAAAAQLVFDP